MRSMVLQRDKEHAERATLVAQERLIRGKVRVSVGMRVGVGKVDDPPCQAEAWTWLF